MSAWLSDPANTGSPIETRLKASERVIARVTDGIYREPASALRELISNAWDADANKVTVLTDAPRFSRIYVRDDGAGMSYEALSRLIYNIGGSPKRRSAGRELGITAHDDLTRTPGGRPLIGKIGIGLFSVSQLSRSFRIVTKARGADYQLVADVRLHTFSEDTKPGQDEVDVAGNVSIRREATADLEAHGTDVVLYDIKPRVRDLLRDADRWEAILREEEEDSAGIAADMKKAAGLERPKYHVGYIASPSLGMSETAVFEVDPKLPWADKPPSTRMASLTEAVEGEFSRVARPDLRSTLDAYLEMVWSLSLAVPVEYVDQHPFDIADHPHLRVFWLGAESKRRAQEISQRPGESVRDAVQREVQGNPKLTNGLDSPAGPFRVYVDGVQLKRPIRFRYIRTGRRGLDDALLFVGRYRPDLTTIPGDVRGGSLDLEGYLFWNGRVVPKENNGVLIRIRGASGALFDPTFLNYQISEQTRLRQITSELYVEQGLDAALNIDRESYNYAHPHVQLVALWLHRSIRQLTNRHKEVSKAKLNQRRTIEAEGEKRAVIKLSERIWEQERGDDPPPDVAIAASEDEATRRREEGYLAVTKGTIAPLDGARGNEKTRREAQVEALIRVLAAFRVIEDRPYDEQQALIDAITRVFLEEGS